MRNSSTSDAYKEVIVDIEDSFRDAIGDNPNVNEDDIYHDIIVSRFYDSDIPMEVKRDLARRQLGWMPEEDADLYELYGIDQA